MSWRSYRRVFLAACLIAATISPTSSLAVDGGVSSEVALLKYVPMDAPAGTSKAVIVQGHALVHTRQIMATDKQGKLVGKDQLDQQVKQVLDNLDAVLKTSGSGLDQLVRVNVYAMAPEGVDQVREQLKNRLPGTVRPTLTGVLTPLPDRFALVAVDVVAVAKDQGTKVTFQGGDSACADSAILPRGGVVYLSGMPAFPDLTLSAVDVSMQGLWKELDELKLTPDQVVHIKVFLRPASSAADVLKIINKYFPGKKTPPVVFVEWLAPPPVEIEMIAQLPQLDSSAPAVQYYNPPYVRPLQIFSKVAIVNTDRQIYIGGIFPASNSGRNMETSIDVFDQLQAVLAETGSDLLHMAKATYYVSDDGAAVGTDRVRLGIYDQDTPPAASKCMVHGVGMAGRKLTLDMIAVSAK